MTKISFAAEVTFKGASTFYSVHICINPNDTSFRKTASVNYIIITTWPCYYTNWALSGDTHPVDDI